MLGSWYKSGNFGNLELGDVDRPHFGEALQFHLGPYQILAINTLI
jgi:hypothetical protein